MSCQKEDTDSQMPKQLVLTRQTGLKLVSDHKITYENSINI